MSHLQHDAVKLIVADATSVVYNDNISKLRCQALQKAKEEDSFMKNLKENASGIVLCLFELVVGLLLMINPVGFTSTIILVAGVILMIAGLACVVKYFKADAKEAAVSQNLMKGLASMLVGGFCAFKSHWFIATFPVLTMIYGVVILMTGLSKVQLAVDMLRMKNKHWFWAAINAVVSIICAIIVLGAPFTSAAVLWVFTGVSLIVEAVFDVVTLIAGRDRTAQKA